MLDANNHLTANWEEIEKSTGKLENETLQSIKQLRIFPKTRPPTLSSDGIIWEDKKKLNKFTWFNWLKHQCLRTCTIISILQ